jgi:hypothetical protein
LGWLASFRWARKVYRINRASLRLSAKQGEKMIEEHRNSGIAM